MKLLAAEVRGLADLPHVVLDDLGMEVGLQGREPALCALGDALELWFSAFEAPRLARVLERLGWVQHAEELEFVGDIFPEQCIWTHSELSRRWCGQDARKVSVELSLGLDAEQIGDLRASLREPHLLQALMEEAAVSARICFLFSRSMDAMSINMDRLHIGGHPLVASESTAWTQGFFSDLPRRFHRLGERLDPAALACRRALSLHSHSLYSEFRQTLEGHWDVRSAHDGYGRPTLLLDDWPLRSWGPGALLRVRHAAAIYLTGAEIIWIDGPVEVDPKPGVQLINAGAESGVQLPDSPERGGALSFRPRSD
jgi:hypothetical protein